MSRHLADNLRAWALLTIPPVVAAALLFLVIAAHHVATAEQDARDVTIRAIWGALEREAERLGASDARTEQAVAAVASATRPLLGDRGTLFVSYASAEEASTLELSAPLTAGRVSRIFPISRGGAPAGALVALLQWRQAPWDLPTGVTGWLAGALFATFALWWLAYVVASRRILEPLSAEIAALRRSAAVAKATQMLAHDVRKPLSLVRLFLRQIAGAGGDASRIRQVAGEFAPQIEKALSAADGMIADVMEIGAKAQLVCEPASPEALVDATLRDVFRLAPDAEVTFEYRFRHAQKVRIDTVKVMRVFANVVANGVQAMKRRGTMWFETREVTVDGREMTEFCVGNSGSYIAEADRALIFEAFFTKDKKGGTGLGLAIARKIVDDHGGRIWCRSSEEDGTEFLFTLPTESGVLNRMSASLPQSTADLRRGTATAPALDVSHGEDTEAFEALKSELLALTQALGAVRVLVIDDEPVYRNGVRALVEGDAALAGAVDVVLGRDASEGLALARDAAPHLVICDVDLGEDSLDGFHIVRTLRDGGYRGIACLHSNTIPDPGQVDVEALGASAFVAKPLSKTQLLELVTSSLRERQRAATPPSRLVLPERPLVAVIDDDVFLLDAWAHEMTDAEVRGFTSVSGFLAHVDQNRGWLERLSLIVTDYYLDDGETGAKLARAVHPRTDAPIILCSDAPPGSVDGGELFSLHIRKEPASYGELLAQLRAVRTRMAQ